MRVELLRTPDVTWPLDDGRNYRPSWTGYPGYVSDEHAGLWQRVGARPGVADEAACLKLYEIAAVAGAAVVECGTAGGRESLALICGLLHAAAGKGNGTSPQLFSISADTDRLKAAHAALREDSLTDHVLQYRGALGDFVRDVPLTPSAACVQMPRGDRVVWADLARLSTVLPNGAPVLCVGWDLHQGARDAGEAWIARGAYEAIGRFGNAVLLRAVNTAERQPLRLQPTTFAAMRDALLGLFLADGGGRLDVRRATRPARDELDVREMHHGRCGRGPWPYVDADETGLPPTLPDGGPWPRISIVTPSYNQGDFIEQTILSVLNQGYPNVEHIIMDGGSTDATPAILERYRDRLACVVSEPDNGQGDAINKGMARTTGEILTWLNSDDMLAPGALAAMAMAFHTSGADLVAGVCQIHREGKLVEQHLTGCAPGPLPLEDILDIDHCWMGGQFFYQPEVMFSRALWQRAGGRVDESLHFSMDYELWLRFAEHGGRLAVIGRPITLFRVHEEQKTTDTQAFEAELVEVRKAFLQRTGRPAWSKPDGDRGRLSLRITCFNDIGYRAGAGLAHQRLARAAGLAGHDVTVIGVSPEATYDNTQPVTSQAIVTEIEQTRPDLVMVGNLHSAAVDASVLAVIAARWPTVYIMHDQWALTGRCAYTKGCEKHVTGCDHTCPTPDEYPALAPDKIAPAWQTKYNLLTGAHPPVLLANSQWTAAFARHALAAHRQHDPDVDRSAPVEPIQLGVPADVFKPRDRGMCREELGLPHDKFIILTSGTSVSDPRKGIAHLAQALEQLQLPHVLCVALGHFNEGEAPPIPGMRALGHLDNQTQIAKAYAAADLFVGPSLAEAFGQVFVEAAACGVPAVGYPVGGVPEAIVDGITGRLATEVHPDALAEVIEELYTQPGLRQAMRHWARLYFENHWSLPAVAQRFHVALARAGLRDRLNLRRKVRLLPAEPGLPPVRWVEQRVMCWEAVDGFADWEGPNQRDGLPRCRWALGPVARFRIRVEEPARYRLLLEGHNYWEGQRIRVAHGGHTVSEEDIPVGGNDSSYITGGEIDLAPGTHDFEAHFWVWDQTRPSRPAAFLVTNIALVPAADAPRRQPAEAAHA